MTRADLQALARIRLQDAAVLLRAGNFDGAYYLCGYVVECALKACIAKETRRFEFPDRVRANDSWSHDPVRLVRTAHLAEELERARRADPEFSDNWTIVRDWSVDSRYERYTQQGAEDLYRAVADRQHGVLRWIRGYW